MREIAQRCETTVWRRRRSVTPKAEINRGARRNRLPETGSTSSPSLERVSSTRQDLLVGLRRRRIRCSSSGPQRCTQRQIVVWSASRPRSFRSSSTSRSDSEYRRYQRTALRMRTGSVCRHLKIAGRVAISGSLQATSRRIDAVATQPSRLECPLTSHHGSFDRDGNQRARIFP